MPQHALCLIHDRAARTVQALCSVSGRHLACRNGWNVVAVDISGVAIGWAVQHARETDPAAAAQRAEVAVSVPNRDINGGETTRIIRFTLPAAIAPHQIRLLRIMWVSDICEAKGAATIIDEISVRVRVGWFTKTETIPLAEGWAVSGTAESECH